MNGWWYRASVAQRLAQVDAGLELGMTAKQIALASGARRRENIKQFCATHDRHLTWTRYEAQEKGRATQANRKGRREAYLRGDAASYWEQGAAGSLAEPEMPEELILE